MAHECGCRPDVPDWFFAWDCCGCRARWLATLPSREWRQQAINEWRKDGEVEMVAKVIERLKEMARV
jgi:hypothetical protein